ncbi:hypothetical protein F4777DRAFT_584556 [Nemania sp. FL0916]|nr:hypothetical protein F4777DRAFT_584556 [Nemania sp. FL0916]
MAITVSRRPEGILRTDQHQHQHQQHRQAQHQHSKHTRPTRQQGQQQQDQHVTLPPAIGAGAARMKRPLNPIDNLSDPSKAKRTRIAVEIFARPLAQALGPSKALLVRRQRPATPPVQTQQAQQAQQAQTQAQAQVAPSHTSERPDPATTDPLLLAPLALRPSTSIAPAGAVSPNTAPPSRLTRSQRSPPPPSWSPSPTSPPSLPPQRSRLVTTAATTTATATTSTTTTKARTTAESRDHGLTRHQEKVINGIRHELDRLQPAADSIGSTADPPGRKLRSQEAIRFKSELGSYFPEYDEVIGNKVPKEQHFISTDTPIIVLDTEHGVSDPIETVASGTAASIVPTKRQQPVLPDPEIHHSTVRLYSDHLFTDVHNSSIVKFDLPPADFRDDGSDDPLPDSHFVAAHRRPERLERSLRNTERRRAQHEKEVVTRLLGELQGPDWLRTMGVNGVTESRKKSFEPARDHFIRGCQAIIDKFRLWGQEEKRRRLERERVLADESSEDDEDDDDEEDVEDEDDDAEENEGQHEEDVKGSDCSERVGSVDDVDMADVEHEGDRDGASDGEPPEYSDVDEAARQLHDEAMERARYAASASPKRARGEPPPAAVDPAPREFTSFFEKRHQREAALNKSRRRGRIVLAWGHPVPDMSEYDFELPDFCLDEDTLKAHERQKRRNRRQSKQ